MNARVHLLTQHAEHVLDTANEAVAAGQSLDSFVVLLVDARDRMGRLIARSAGIDVNKVQVSGDGIPVVVCAFSRAGAARGFSKSFRELADRLRAEPPPAGAFYTVVVADNNAMLTAMEFHALLLSKGGTA